MAKANQRRKTGTGDGFWGSPPLMNLMSDLLLLAAGVLLAWAGAALLQRLPVFPLRQVIVTQAPEQVSRAQIEHAARTAFSGNFFTVNLESAQAAFEKLPWVRRADLRRRWPDAIELALEEHVAVARWTPLEGEPRLVNRQGEVFLATGGATLPAFVGPEGSSPRVLARYHEFAAGLRPIGRTPAGVALSAREAWQMRLDDGTLLDLGRDQPKHPLAERLARFAEHYPQVKARLPAVGVVDMRYPNGFALRGAARAKG